MIINTFFDPKSIIALLALFVALWSIITSRKHNKLTVKPHVYESIETDAISFSCRFYLINKGLGPAIIKSSTYYLDGEEVEFNKLLNIIEKLPSEFGIRISKVKPGSAISKDEEYPIIEIMWDKLKYNIPEDKETRNKIANDVRSFSTQIAKRFGLVVVWESAYGERGELNSHPVI